MISLIPLWISILSPYGLLLYDSVIFSNEISLIANQNLIQVIKTIAILGDLLILIDITVLVLFFFKEINKFYYSRPVLERFLHYYTENQSVSQLTFMGLGSHLGLSDQLIGVYVRNIISYNPEIGEIDEIAETFTNSSKTVIILQELIDLIIKSPQERFRQRHLRFRPTNHQIRSRNIVTENADLDSSIDDRKNFYSNLLDGSVPIVLQPHNYIQKVADQFIFHKINVKNGIISLLILFMVITIPFIIIDQNSTFSDKIFIVLVFILCSVVIPTGAYGLEALMNKAFPNLNENTYKHMIKALETGNVEILVKEVKRMEDSMIKYHSKKDYKTEIFWYCKAYLLILTNALSEAQIILEKQKRRIRKRLALRGEIDMLLARTYVAREEKVKALDLLREAKSVFEKNNITEPISLINEKINLINQETTSANLNKKNIET